MTVENVKLSIIEKILALNSMEVLLKIQSLVGKTLKDKQSELAPDNVFKGQSFEEWSLQFEDDEDTNLDEFLPEHGMTLLQLRRTIWEGEQGKEMTYSEFLADQQTWRK
jgi:hypothetical protein